MLDRRVQGPSLQIRCLEDKHKKCSSFVSVGYTFDLYLFYINFVVTLLYQKDKMEVYFSVQK